MKFGQPKAGTAASVTIDTIDVCDRRFCKYDHRKSADMSYRRTVNGYFGRFSAKYIVRFDKAADTRKDEHEIVGMGDGIEYLYWLSDTSYGRSEFSFIDTVCLKRFEENHTTGTTAIGTTIVVVGIRFIERQGGHMTLTCYRHPLQRSIPERERVVMAARIRAVAGIAAAGITDSQIIARNFMRSGMQELWRDHRANADTLTATAVVASVLAGKPESSLTLLALSNVAEMMTTYAAEKAWKNITGYLSLDQHEAWIIENGKERKSSSIPVRCCWAHWVRLRHYGQRLSIIQQR